jgi:cytidylate kinase
MIPIIAIDGPAASGKGTVASELARKLHYEYLDSGAWYRAIAWYLDQSGLDITDEQSLSYQLEHCHIQQIHDQMTVNQKNVTDIIRTEQVGSLASKWAVIPQIRRFLTARFRACIKGKGLVADGRDMGSVVFPEAMLKIYLTATPEERARRRVNQLNAMGKSVKMSSILEDILDRDKRDANRTHAPLHSNGYQVIDSTELNSSDVVHRIMGWWAEYSRESTRFKR